MKKRSRATSVSAVPRSHRRSADSQLSKSSRKKAGGHVAKIKDVAKTKRAARGTTPKRSPDVTAGKPIPLHLLSDSTGNLASHMLSAFLTQFPRNAMAVRVRNFVNTLTKLDIALEQSANEGGVVFHALVRKEFKKRVADFCEARNLPCCDLTGDFIRFISRATGIAPSDKVDVLHEVSDEYRDRIESLEFTLAHDDGLGLDTIHHAEIVLVGISRTSKTPTSILLGQSGYRTANVALAIEVPPPAQLLQLPHDRVIGLLIDPMRLQDVRSTRGKDWSMNDTNYTDIEHIQQEVLWSRKLFNSKGWRTIDVTNSAIEETAARIIAMVKRSK